MPGKLPFALLRNLNLLHLSIVTVLSVVIGLMLKSKFGSDWYELAGFVTGVVGVYLVAVAHIINWPVGLLNVAIYGYVYFSSRFYADMSLQVFFFALGVQGWYMWARGGNDKSELPISRIPLSWWPGLGLCLVVGTAIYFPIISHFKGVYPFLDSVLTVASIIAQLLLNAKKIENWIIWIVVDIVYIPLYYSRHLEATAVLYALLLCLAIGGLVGWLKTLRSSAIVADPLSNYPR